MPSSDKKNYVIAFLACTTLAGAALYIRTNQQLADARSAPKLQVTKTEIKTAAAPAPVVSAAPQPISDEREAMPEAGADERGDGGPQNGPGGRGQRGGGNFGAQMAELMKDPEFVAAMKTEQLARIEQRYGELFKSLNLPPDQLAKLKDLLVERENAGRDVMASAREQGLDMRNADSRDQLRQLTADLQAEIDASIGSTLGTNVADALTNYNSTTQQRNAVNNFNEKLANTVGGQTLNSSQSQQFATILADTGTQQGRNVLITDATITRAAAVLTNDQLTALKQLQAEQQAQQLIQAKMRAARDAARAANGNNNGGNRNRD